MANRYLDPVDHLVKDRLRVRAYPRYMELACAVEDAGHAIRLRLHPWEVMPTRSGVGIVGYRILPDQVRVRRSTVARAERRLRRLRGSADFQRRLVATFTHWASPQAPRRAEREPLGVNERTRSAAPTRRTGSSNRWMAQA